MDIPITIESLPSEWAWQYALMWLALFIIVMLALAKVSQKSPLAH
jgi:hypothetical protein